MIPKELDARIRKAASRDRVSKGEWVRRAIELALREGTSATRSDPLARLSQLDGPTADIDQLLREIEKGRA